MKLLILADDFTGAMDTGVQLSKAQIKTLVFSRIPDRKTSKALPPCEVLVLHTNLRHETPGRAYQVICGLLSDYYRPGLAVYLKTDSALRGNISAVLAAAVHTLKRPLHFIPAFPDAGRTIKDGLVYIDGVLLENSVFRNDPRSPMKESGLHPIVTRDYPLGCRLLSAPSEGMRPLWDKPLKNSSGACPQIYLYDGSTKEDLSEIAAYLAAQDALALTAGCAGFAMEFPKHMAFSREEAYTPDAPGPLLFLSGSANAITFRQLAKAEERGYPLLPMKEYLEASIKGEPSRNSLEDALTEKAVSLLKEGKSVILAAARNKDSLLDITALSKSAGSKEAVHAAISACCCRLVRRILTASDISCLTVFGGDTVAGILEELDVPYVTAKGEIDTGVPLCLLSFRPHPDAPEKTMHLITKSGGLGCEDIVNSIDKYFNP